MIFEIILWVTFISVCCLSYRLGIIITQIETIDSRISKYRSELDKLKPTVGLVKTVQSKIDKLEDRIKKSEEPKTYHTCSSTNTEDKYTKSEVDARFEELYELLGIEKEDYIEEDYSTSDLFSKYFLGRDVDTKKSIKQRLVFKKKTKKK